MIVVLAVSYKGFHCLSALSPDSSSELKILGHDRHTLGVDCAQIGVLEQTNKVRLGSLLKGQQCL